MFKSNMIFRLYACLLLSVFVYQVQCFTRFQHRSQYDNLIADDAQFAVHPSHDDSGTGFVSCGTRTVNYDIGRSGKIVGGSETPYGAFPWQVEIKKLVGDSGTFDHHCGGAVVGPRTVVTAAHCFDQHPLEMETFRVVTGEHRLRIRDPHEHSFRLRRVSLHPDFRKSGPHSNDIALVGVGVGAGGIPFTSHVRPICLPRGPPPTGPCAVTGWGSVHEGTETFSPVLRAAAVPLVDPATCRKLGVYGGRQQPILDSMICAGLLQGGIDACGGDSGGPLACERDGRFELTGLVSWGDGCAKKNRPGVYTKVHSYSQWITDTMRDMGD